MPEDPFDDHDESNVGEIDSDILDRIGRRLEGSSRFSDVAVQPEYAPDSVIIEFDLGYFPVAVVRSYLRIRWYTTDDFTVHYSEQYEDGSTWECRWDRHPNDHNIREHFHPPPDATTPGEDAHHPDDWRDVVSTVLAELEQRIKAFWQ